MAGVFGLRSPADLLKKLEWEYERFAAERSNAYLAYNFVVTAWHLLEWNYPGAPHSDAGRARKKIRDSQPLLQICEHLAVGAKHFDQLDKRHQSVAESGPGGVWRVGSWRLGAFRRGSWGEWLSVSLEGEPAQALYGKSVRADVLARDVLDWWKTWMEGSE